MLKKIIQKIKSLRIIN